MLDCDVNQRLDLEMTSVRNGVEHELVEFERFLSGCCRAFPTIGAGKKPEQRARRIMTRVEWPFMTRSSIRRTRRE
jgi:hypothetical protein